MSSACAPAFPIKKGQTATRWRSLMPFVRREDCLGRQGIRRIRTSIPFSFFSRGASREVSVSVVW
jgi:hypothetical protein